MKFQPLKAMRTLFGYHSIQDKKRRKAPTTITRSTDAQLDTTGRKKMIATARDCHENYILMAWMIRQHADFASRFTFRGANDDEELNKKLEALMTWRSRAKQWDVAGRHTRQRYLRLMEIRRLVDGDVLSVRIGGGLHQAIEADRITKPTDGTLPDNLKTAKFTHGVSVTKAGKARSYCVTKRDGDRLIFDKLISAQTSYLLGYYERFDQVRGVTPFAQSLNRQKDLGEGLEYALLKAKMHSMFGVFLERNPDTEDEEGFDYVDRSDGGEPDQETRNDKD